MRELENVVQRALVLAVGGVIGMEHLLVDGGLEDFMEQMPSEVAVTETPEVEVGQEQETAAYMQATGTDGMNFAYSMGRQPEPPVIGRGLSEVARDSEQKVILATLKRFKGSRKDTAQELGVSPRTLRYKLAKMKDQGVHIPG